MRLADVPGLPPERLELAGLVDTIAAYLENMGGKITDVGYCFPEDYGEFVCAAPDGTRIEVRAKMLGEDTPGRHCSGCDGGNSGAGPCKGL